MKYKRINIEGIKHPDLYQLLAYTLSTQLPRGLLIYADGEGEPAEHVIVHSGKKLRVITIDLHASPDEILKRIAGIAEQIKAEELHRR